MNALKGLVSMLLLTTATAAFAQSEKDFFSCREIDGDNTMVIEQLGNQSRKEGVKYDYSIKLMNGFGEVWHEGVLTGESEDVILILRNKKGRKTNSKVKSLSVTIYLDEYEQTSLYLNGKDFNYDCTPTEQQ